MSMARERIYRNFILQITLYNWPLFSVPVSLLYPTSYNIIWCDPSTKLRRTNVFTSSTYKKKIMHDVISAASFKVIGMLQSLHSRSSLIFHHSFHKSFTSKFCSIIFAKISNVIYTYIGPVDFEPNFMQLLEVIYTWAADQNSNW